MGLVWSAWTLVGAPPVAVQPEVARPFQFIHEFYGSRGYADPQLALNLRDGMMNGVALWPPVDPGVPSLSDKVDSVMLRLAGSPGPAGVSAEEIDRQRDAFAGVPLAPLGGEKFWILLPEWDQSGGAWVPRGRPSYRNLSRQDAHRRLLSYYESTHPEVFRQLTRALVEDRSYRLTAITDHSPNVFYGYEIGAELQLLERGIDELGDLSTGLAYLRGAARQYSRAWGIDLSTWRSTTNKATTYDAGGQLLGGWSAGYIERMYYLAFAAGAGVILNEAATYRTPEVTRRFADFAIRRHPDIGSPSVNLALMVDHFAGFDPKHGIHNQAEAVWYQDIPYSDGDRMIDNVLRAAYPGHWLHGLTPGAPFANGAGVPDVREFERYLAQGNDPRPYEPMPTTRWGDNLDIVSTNASPEGLNHYRVIVLLGDPVMNDRIRETLTAWVARGGVLVVNSVQASQFGDEFLGIERPQTSAKVSSSSRWVSDRLSQSEPVYSYSVVTPKQARVLAVNDGGDPLITSRSWEAGEVMVATPQYLQSNGRDRLLEIGGQLIDHLVSRYEPIRVLGAPIEYVIGRPSGKVVITLANHLGSEWRGQISIPRKARLFNIVEYVSDQPLEGDVSDSELKVQLTVPPYGVRVVAMEERP
jgi:hypothetical protein